MKIIERTEYKVRLAGVPHAGILLAYMLLANVLLNFATYNVLGITMFNASAAPEHRPTFALLFLMTTNVGAGLGLLTIYGFNYYIRQNEKHNSKRGHNDA